MMLRKVISGGSTGADMGALVAAKALGFETGGKMPWEFYTESGKKPELALSYGMEVVGGCKSMKQSMVVRSMKNVDDADATVAFRIFSSGGTDKTISYALKKKWCKLDSQWRHLVFHEVWHKPVLVIEDIEDAGAVAEKIVAFLQKHNVTVLNVAGHRESIVTTFSIHDAVRNILLVVLGYMLNVQVENEETDARIEASIYCNTDAE